MTAPLVQSSPAAHGYIDRDALVVHYLRFSGVGRPVVLLHGVTGSAWDWHHVGRELGSRLASAVPIAMDFRGHGDSGWSASCAYRSQDHASDVSALVDDLGAGAVDLVGYSWGALVAIAVATRMHSLVRRLVLVDVEASFEQSETEVMPRPRRFASIDDAVAARREEIPNVPQDLVTLTTLAAYRPETGGSIAPKHDPYFFEHWPFRADDRWDELAGLTQPTLLVHAEDSFVRGDVMDRMAEVVPDGHLVHLPATTHIVPADNPIGMLDTLVEFLAPT